MNKFIKTFEEYKPEIHAGINVIRDLNKSKFIKKALYIMSLIDDFVHLDFKNIKNTFKNKEGFRKLSDMLAELSGVIFILEQSKNSSELELFYDMEEYGIDAKAIMDCLNDESVKKYLAIDKRADRALYEGKFKKAIDFLKRYSEWK